MEEGESFMHRLRRFFLELNLFKTNENDANTIRVQRWSTRLYIPVLLISMSILLVYTALHVQSVQIQINNPSLSTYFNLVEKYGDVKCPCRQISFTHDQFLQISVELHQVCSSDFVSDDWIKLLYQKDITTLRYTVDFRSTAFNQFQLLQQLCQLSRVAINDGIQSLYQSSLISGQLLNQDLFSAQVESDISSFQTITIADFARSLLFMRTFMAGNELLTAVETAYTLIIDFTVQNLVPPLITNSYTEIDGSTCMCDSDLSCHLTAGFYNFTAVNRHDVDYDLTKITPQAFVDGWKVACWPLESLLLSSLQIFYNQSALNQIVTYVNASILPNHFHALNTSINSSFSSNSTLQSLVDQLFVEKWFEELNYSSYYSQCQPQFCQYNINQGAQPLYMITSLLGLYGGLSVVLHLIIPLIIKFVLERLNKQTTVLVAVEEPEHIGWNPCQWIKNLGNTLLHLNLFRSPLRIAPADIKHQIWSTRLYILLLLLSFFILIVYSSVSMGTRIIQINTPSLHDIQKLENQSYSLTCPCTTLSIDYKYLFELQPIYHQICSSAFVSSAWIDYLGEIADSSLDNYDNRDFRTTSSSQFHILSSMCQLSNTTVINALFQFQQTELITNELLEIDLFTNEITSAIEQFKLTLPNDLLRLLQIIRNVTDINQFISGGYSNFAVVYYTDNQSTQIIPTLKTDGFLVTSSNGSESKCLCADSFTCETNSLLFTYDDSYQPIGPYYTVPNFYTGCYPIESLLPSTMECFYSDNACFDIVNNITNETLYQDFAELNPNETSSFPVNATINDLLNQLFIDSWLTILNYSSYFEKCQPLYCTYTITQRKTPIEIVTTIAALIGGLSTIFKLISPYIVSIFFYLIDRYRHQQQPNHPQIQENANTNLRMRIRNFLIKLRDIVLNLNLFEDVNNPHEIPSQRQSTRVYICLLSLIVVILVLYTSLTYQSNQITVSISTVDSLIDFQNSHNSTFVNCPCTKLSSIRSTYYQIQPRFHEICSSDFVSDQWLNSFIEKENNGSIFPRNILAFSDTAFAQFRSLSVMCNLAKQAVDDGRNLYLETSVVSSQMPNRDLFDLQTNSTLNDFQSSLPNTFLHNLQMFRGLSQGSGFISIYSSNWNLYLRNLSEDPSIYLKSQSYDDCDCAISSSCIANSTPNVLGYVVGCLPLEALLRSTLECFYDQLCVNQISSSSSFIPKSLNQSNSRFAWNTTINEIVEEMFIESWSINISYSNFFQECQPKSCSYIQTEQNNLVYVITTLLGLYGGITILLKLIIPPLMNQLYKCINRFHRRNHELVPM